MAGDVLTGRFGAELAIPLEEHIANLALSAQEIQQFFKLFSYTDGMTLENSTFYSKFIGDFYNQICLMLDQMSHASHALQNLKGEIEQNHEDLSAARRAVDLGFAIEDQAEGRFRLGASSGSVIRLRSR